ncbi:Hypp6557 [Branchiostoma lanceolatum]|uniref:Hypp6557 protein n=1 Tax=Branchiostoma lanceolatum TaxID=7740 RepID=A0A8J9YV12_BRALA|nr:Hypp6557 [Branchiostoma lanceolatum]
MLPHVQKKSDRWSVCVQKVPKTYDYIKELQAAIVDRRIQSDYGMSRTQPMAEDDPRCRGHLSAVPAPTTSAVVEQHRSRIDRSTQDSQDT